MPTGKMGSSYLVNKEDLDPPFSLMDRIRNSVDRFKAYMAKTFCTCISTVPSFALMILAAVLLMLLVATIPLAFAFTYMNPEPRISELPKATENVIRYQSVLFPNGNNVVRDTLSIFKAKSVLPPQIDTCKGFGFSCTNEPSQVVGTNKRCDGFRDCQDGSDEQDCQECQTVLHCMGHNKRKVCLRGSYLCDGIEQCKSGIDENQFCRSNCSKAEFKCKGANNADICLPDQMICDGDIHCKFGEDEMNCKDCTNNAKFCKPLNTCIPKFKICDGIRDCPDSSDELGCDCMSCSGNDRVLCNGTLKMCINKKKLCDGIDDCPNGEDELKCPGSCHGNITSYIGAKQKPVLCADGKWYHWKYACGGLIEACKGKCTECNNEAAFDCNAEIGENKTRICIDRTMVCDKKADCPGELDEMHCNCQSQNMKMCSIADSSSPKCFNLKQKCDGVWDCPLGDDEKNCSECINEAFYCKKDSKCISSLKRCDGISDCSDEEDEMMCKCEDCKIHPFQTYMCQSGSRCFRQNNVCNPLSQCPDANQFDQMYCALNAGGGRAFI